MSANTDPEMCRRISERQVLPQLAQDGFEMGHAIIRQLEKERDELRAEVATLTEQRDEARRLLTDIARRTRRETQDERIELERRILGYQKREGEIRCILLATEPPHTTATGDVSDV